MPTAKLVKVDGEQCLQFTVPLEDARPSKSGNMILIASSGGWVKSDLKVKDEDGDTVKVRFNLTAGY